MGWKRLLVIFFFPWLWLVKKWDMVKTCLQVFLEGHPCSVWSLWSTAECVEGKEQAVKGRSQEPPALMCSVGWAEDGGQIPVLICKELCTCVVHGSVYCGMGGSSFHLIHLAETEHKLSCLGSSCYRPDFFFFQDMKMYFDSTGKPFPTQLTPWDESSYSQDPVVCWFWHSVK